MAAKSDAEDPTKKRYTLYSNTDWVVEKNGMWIFPTFFEKEEEVRQLDVKPGDVWVASVPKSGTTWMQEMAWLLTHNLDFQGAKTLLKYRSPGIEGCWSYKYLGFPEVPLSEFERLASLSGGRRILKTHLHYWALPEKLRAPNSPGKIIFVARNPKDACISYYYFHLLYEKWAKLDLTIDDFCQSFMSGVYITGAFWNQVKEFWNRRNDPNILFVKYEDMKKDLKKVVEEVAAFLEVPVPNGEQMQRLLNHLSFESMKHNRALNREQGESTLRNDEINENGRFIRKGIIGDWKQKMSPETIKQFDEWIKENTKDTDLRFEDV